MQRYTRWLFRSVSFTLRDGDALFVQGFNGVGKSTLLRALAGLSPPSTGHISWMGDKITKSPSSRTPVAYLGHQSGLLLNLSVMTYLNRILCLSQQTCFSETDIQQWLIHSQLDGCQHTLCSRLSAGQRQRLALMRCRLLNQAVWLLDEPFSSLDSAGQEWACQLMEAQCASGGMIVYTDHQALYTGTHVLNLNDYQGEA